MTAELVMPNDQNYGEIKNIAEQIYLEELGVAPTSPPSLYLALYHNSQVIGAVGIWEQKQNELFLTQKYCLRQSVDPQILVPSLGQNNLAEIGNLNMLKYYRKDYLNSLIGLAYCYCYFRGFRFMFLIYGRHIVKSFKTMGTKVTDFCEPKISNYDGTEEEKQKWSRVYFNKLRPKCAVMEATQAYQSCKNLTELNPIKLGESLIDLRGMAAWLDN